MLINFRNIYNPLSTLTNLARSQSHSATPNVTDRVGVHDYKLYDNLYKKENPTLEADKATSKDPRTNKGFLENITNISAMSSSSTNCLISDFDLSLDKKKYNSDFTPLSSNNLPLQNIPLIPNSGEYKTRFSTKGTDLLFIKELQDQFKFNPALSLSFAVTLFSMAGIPPFIGFFLRRADYFVFTNSIFWIRYLVNALGDKLKAGLFELAIVNELRSVGSMNSENHGHEARNESTRSLN